MDYRTIRYEVADRVLTMTLARPDKMNAFDPVMMAEFLDAFDQADRDDAVRAIIVTGAGRAFSSGADISKGADTFDFQSRPDKAALGSPKRPDGSVDYAHPAVQDIGGRIALRILESLKPVIAAVNGPAIGMGATLLLPMDIRLASVDAKFSFPFVRRGLVQESCASWFLPRIVGIGTALEWCMTGRTFSASEALARGLVRSIHPQDDLLPAAWSLAREIAENAAPVSVALSRQLLWKSLATAGPEEAHRIESRSIYVRGQSEDLKEGIESFREKRPPDFKEAVSNGMPDFYPWHKIDPYS
jgi:enoyl-CoA hydratase/carnithine racemase